MSTINAVDASSLKPWITSNTGFNGTALATGLGYAQSGATSTPLTFAPATVSQGSNSLIGNNWITYMDWVDSVVS